MVVRQKGATAVAMAFAWASIAFVVQVVQAQSVSVTESGLASYSYPIVVPPGIAGLTPQLSLAYSSGGGAGVLGWGWSVSGLSAISRCPMTQALDGQRGSVRFDATDRFCLDGQRLIATDGNGKPLADQSGYQAPGSGYVEYRTERDVFSRIRAYGQANGAAANGPAYFKVWTRGGQILEFGNTSDSHIEVEGGNIVFTWALNRFSDVATNYVDFKYTKRDVAWGSGASTDTNGIKTGREWRIDQILYTGNATKSQAATNRVQFVYDDSAVRPDAVESYHAGYKSVAVSKLYKITTYAGASGVRTVLPVYDGGNPNSGRLRVASIKECAGASDTIGQSETNCLPAPSFGYTSGTNGAYTAAGAAGLSSVALVDANSNYTPILGDFDGDGKTDILRAAATPADNVLYFSRPTAGQSGTSFTSASLFNLTNVQLTDTLGCFVTVATDVNGDGLTDLVRWASPNGIPYNSSSDNAVCQNSDKRTLVFFSNGDGTFGDGKTAGGAPVDITALHLTKRSRVTTGSGNQSNTNPSYNFMFGDFDGDGRIDIVKTYEPRFGHDGEGFPVQGVCSDNPYAGEGCTAIFRGNGDGTFSLVSTNLSEVHNYIAPSYVGSFFVDLDGSGSQDLFNKGNGRRYLSRGDGNFDSISDAVSTCSNPVVTLDVNGDGKPDFICPDVSTSAANRLFLNNGRGQFFQSSKFNLSGSGNELSPITDGFSSTAKTYGVVIADFNGDGRVDILRWKDDPSQNVLWLGQGDGSFVVSRGFNLAGTALQNSTGTYTLLLGDFSGHGYPELLRIGRNTADNQLYVPTSYEVPDLLASVTSATQAVTQIDYAAAASAGSPFSAGRVSGQPYGAGSIKYPQMLLTPAMPLVATLHSPAGPNGEQVNSRYQYSGLLGSYDGRGVLGFASMLAESDAPNGEKLTKVTRYRQDYPFAGMVGTSELWYATLEKASSGIGQVLNRTTHYYCDLVLSNTTNPSAPVSASCPETATDTSFAAASVRRPYLRKSYTTATAPDGTTLPTVSSDFTYDAWGNATQIVVATSGSDALGNSQSASNTTTNTYLVANTAGDMWIVGRLARASVSSMAPDQLVGNVAGSDPLASATIGTPLALSLKLSPTSLAFGSKAVGSTNDSASVTLSSSGPGSAVGLTITPPAGYSLINSTCGSTLGQGGSCTFALRFAPTAVQAYNGTLSISANSGAAATSITVTGAGTGTRAGPTVSPGSYGFGSQKDGVTASTTITVTNTGAAASFSKSLVINNGGGFVVGAGTCPANGGTMAANSSCTIVVSFTGVGQCGGVVTTRTATLAVALDGVSSSSALTAANYVYKTSDLFCR